MHGDSRRAGGPVLDRRVRGQLLARLQRHPAAALHRVVAVPRRGHVPHHQHPVPSAVAGQVQGLPPGAVQVRRGGHGRRRAGPVLPARHRGAPPLQGAEHRPRAGAGGPPLHGRLHPVPARDLRAPTRRPGQPGTATAAAQEAAAAADPPGALPPDPERAGDRAGGSDGGVRGGGGGAARRRARRGAGAGGELVRRGAGHPRRGADERVVPAARRRADPGGAVREDGVHREHRVRLARRGHGARLLRLRRERGGELAAGGAGAGAPGDQEPRLRPPKRLGQGVRALPRQAGRPHQRHPLRANAGASARPPTP
uniref:Uncharacterized protein n=1 Tax=Triticum urartu TaxID=4572 RepID=A0A8R7P3C8_TRIUA